MHALDARSMLMPRSQAFTQKQERSGWTWWDEKMRSNLPGQYFSGN
jgi:hypothetical protein